MTQKPEALLWSRLKKKIPWQWSSTRIENRIGGGVPDVHICGEGVPFWLELKVTKTNRVNISAGQVAWNYAYSKSGGVSFFLVHPLSSPNLYLFDGSQGRGLVEHGLRTGRSGSGSVGARTIVPCLWSGDDWSGLVVDMLEIARGRVGVGAQGRVGSGSGPAVEVGSGPTVEVGVGSVVALGE